MSHYTTIDTEFKDEACLMKALKDMGWKDGQIKKYDEPQQLEGYQGDKRNQKAHIIIPRAFVGPAANDIGFVRQQDGTYKAIISEYDRTVGGTNDLARATNGYNQKWLGILKQKYSVHKITGQAHKYGYRVSKATTNQKDGSIQLYLYGK